MEKKKENIKDILDRLQEVSDTVVVAGGKDDDMFFHAKGDLKELASIITYSFMKDSREQVLFKSFMASILITAVISKEKMLMLKKALRLASMAARDAFDRMHDEDRPVSEDDISGIIETIIKGM